MDGRPLNRCPSCLTGWGGESAAGHTYNYIRMTGYSGIVQALDERSNLFNELVTRELQIIWEHSFQKVDENSGNGITDKFFDYSGVSRSGPDVQVPEGGYIQTKERGDYGAGQPVIAGGAGVWNQDPTGDQDSYLGYYDRDAGIGGGLGYRHFADGENGATSAGPQLYAFQEQGGENREIVPQEKFNLNRLDGTEGEGPDVDPTDGITVRFPHACYGHSAFVIAVGVKKDTSADLRDGHLRRISDAFELYPVHAFVRKGETMWDEFDVPFVFETTGTQGDGFMLNATACHYEGETGRGVKRSNGEGWSPAKNGGSTLSVPAFPDWMYVMSLRKRTGWEAANIQPNRISLNTDQNVEVELTVGADLSNTAYGLPTDTSSTEAAVEYDLATWDLSTDGEKSTDTTVASRGEREFFDIVPGDKQATVDVSGDLEDVVLSAQEPLSLFVRRATGSQTAVNYAALGNGGGF